MWPWGHLVFGAFSYYGYRRFKKLDVAPVMVGVSLAVGTQFPDLIDKPLSWTYNLLPSGRSLGHSIFTFLIVAALLTKLGSRLNQLEVTTAFLIGYLSHIIGDILPTLLGGDLIYATFFLWPLVSPFDSGREVGIIAHFQTLNVSASLILRLLLAFLISIIWYIRARRAENTSGP